MIVVTIEIWDAKEQHKRSQLHQLVIGNQGSSSRAADGATGYVGYLFGPDDHVPTQGTARAKVAKDKAIAEVFVRHRPERGDLELLFIVMRELRQEFPELFEGASAPTDEHSAEALRLWHAGRMRRINS